MKESGSSRILPSPPPIQIHEYEFVIYVKTCSILLKFPCRFALSWKLDRQTVDCPDKVEQINGKVMFNQELRFRTTLTNTNNNLQPRKGTLFVNYFTMTKPNEPRLAGVVSLDLAKFVDGCEEKDYKLQKELDKQSSLRFAINCTHIRQLQEISDPYSVSRFMQENISQMSLRSQQSREKLSQGQHLSKSKAENSQFVTPKQPCYQETPPSKVPESVAFSPDRTQPMMTSRDRPFDMEYDTPKLRQLSKTFQHNISHSRPPPSTPAVDKEEASHLLAKFESQRRLRQSLQTELNRAREENQQLKNKTDQISDRLFQSQSRVNKLAEMSRVSQQSQIEMLNRQNEQLKNELSQLISRFKDESALSIALQRDNEELRQQYENQHSVCSRLKKQLEGLTPSLGVSLAVSPESNKTDPTEIDILRRKLMLAEEELQRERMMSEKEELLSRIRELEDQLERTEVSALTQDEDLHNIMDMFNAKYEEIVKTCSILEEQCMLLISAVQSKQIEPEINASPFKELIQHRDFQASTDDIGLQFQHSPADSDEINRVRIENESLREETRELQNNLADSRRSLWDFKQLVFRQNERSRVVKRGEKSARYRHHMRHYDRLKNEYIDKLRQMYEEIMHLNEIIYNHNAKEKEMAMEVEEINQKYGFVEAASRQLRQRLKECQEEHQQTIEGLRSSNARLIADILKLKDTIYSQQEQISSLRIQLENMDNSDLLMNTEDMHHDLEASQKECHELKRRCTQMLMYIDELRAECQHEKENLILKDAEIDELRHQLKKRRQMQDSQMGQSAVSLESSAVTALRDVAEVLKVNTGSTKQEEAIKVGIDRLLETHKNLAELDTADSRAQKLRMMDKMREVAIEFNKIKLDRMKSLEGSSELRKEFLRSVRPMQGKLDELLHFGQGVLNSKTSGFRRETALSS